MTTPPPPSPEPKTPAKRYDGQEVVKGLSEEELQAGTTELIWPQQQEVKEQVDQSTQANEEPQPSSE